MICRHCGKEYSDEFTYCPYCAEPKPKKITVDQELKQYKDNMLVKLILKLFVCCGIAVLAFLYFFYIEETNVGVAVFVSIVVFCLCGLVPFLEHFTLIRPGRSRTINMQFSKDQTSICPKCGSHSIKIYRKGYDYSKGLLLRLFDVKGAGFSAGIDSNNACCRCMNCGHDWETDYDYRLINK